MIISFVAFKGGVGKTTLAWLSTPLLAQQDDVAVLDWDPREDLSSSLGVVPQADSLASRLTLMQPLADLKPQACDIGRAEVYSSTSRALVSLERDLVSDPDLNEHTRRAVMELALEYPYTVIDTPGSFSTISQLAIDIADVVVVPTGFDWLDGKGGKETVLYINKRRPEVPIVVVPNKVSKNRRYDTDVLEVISELTSLENVRVALQIGTRVSATRVYNNLPVTAVVRHDPTSIGIRSLLQTVTTKEF